MKEASDINCFLEYDMKKHVCCCTRAVTVITKKHKGKRKNLIQNDNEINKREREREREREKKVT